jgi:hypothetical protein
MNEHQQKFLADFVKLSNMLEGWQDNFIILPIEGFNGRYRIFNNNRTYKSKSMNFQESRRFIEGLKLGFYYE